MKSPNNITLVEAATELVIKMISLLPTDTLRYLSAAVFKEETRRANLRLKFLNDTGDL